MTAEIIDITNIRYGRNKKRNKIYSVIKNNKNARTILRHQVTLNVLNRNGGLEALFDFYNYFSEFMHDLSANPAHDHNILLENLKNEFEKIYLILKKYVTQVNHADESINNKINNDTDWQEMTFVLTKLLIDINKIK